MYHKEDDYCVEEFALALQEMTQHETMRDACEIIYEHGLHKFLLRLADYCSAPKECYALYVLSEFYKENESAFCKDAPTMQ